jgi:hypothetical protein
MAREQAQALDPNNGLAQLEFVKLKASMGRQSAAQTVEEFNNAINQVEGKMEIPEFTKANFKLSQGKYHREYDCLRYLSVHFYFFKLIVFIPFFFFFFFFMRCWFSTHFQKSTVQRCDELFPLCPGSCPTVLSWPA